MSDLISRKAVIEEIRLIEKSLMKDKAEAKEIGDKEVIFSIDNQLSGLWLARCKVGNIKPAYDTDKVVEQLEGIRKDDNIRFADQVVNKAICIVKGGLEE